MISLTGCATSLDTTARTQKPAKPTATPSDQRKTLVLEKPAARKIIDESISNGNHKQPSSAFEKGPQACLDDALEFCQLAQEYRENGELDNALDALDQAYTMILKVDDTQSDIDLIQEKEDLRFLISKRILEIHASRQIVVSGTHDEIPIVINSHVQKEIDRFTKGGENDFFRNAYKRSGRYRKYIIGELKKEGMPTELSWLPLIESGFKTRALSPARALGMWQFIPSTGHKFGLSRDTYIDERMDPVKSTAAAIAYMKELHQMFGDWMTVLAAYNCGEGRVLRTINSQNVNYLDNFWDLYAKLPRETARYVPRFLATLHIMKNKSRYGLDTVTPDPPMSYSVVRVTRRSHLKNYAGVIGVSEETLKMLNPELRTSITPATAYDLKVPTSKKPLLLAKLDTVPVTKPKPKNRYAYHKVRRGQNISAIARRYGVSIRTIARANRLNRRYTIIAGQTLKIPLSRNGYVAQTSSKKKSRKPAIHRVRKGDSLWNLARRYGTTTRAIQRANGMRGTNLKIGQKLSIPGGKAAQLASVKKKKVYTYRVKKGDTPFAISLKNGMTLTRFLKINKLNKRSKIYPGQRVYVE